jgi:chemotaxis protein MotA
MDKASWFGIIIGFGAILLGNMVEGGHVSSLMQLTALMIVLGGTIGAVMVSNTEKDLRRGFEMFRSAFRKEEDRSFQKSMTEIVDCARLARKETVLSLERQIPRLSDPFLAKIMKNVVDGLDVEVIRGIGEAEIDAEEEEQLGAAKIWADAGGFSPTIGIIGAVLGLIHIMGNLSDTSKLGAGIAVAFVATIYGITFANLVFIPIGNKLKKRVLTHARERRIILEGAILVGTTISPLVIEQKLRASIEGAQHV